MAIDWNDIANQAGQQTDQQLSSQISSLTSLNNTEIENLINDTGISQENLVELLQVVNNATASNNEKAAAIENINKGVNVLVEIAKKVL